VIKPDLEKFPSQIPGPGSVLLTGNMVGTYSNVDKRVSVINPFKLIKA
jgi:hypothetical protein